MKGEGNIRKLKVFQMANGMVDYSWQTADILSPQEEVPMSAFVGGPIRLNATGKIHCTVSGRSIRKAYGDGMSYEAFQSSPLAVESIIRPELSRIHEGVALRDAEWEEAHHNQPHVVYLSLTSGIKVGVTRETNIPSRWIDQGASGAIILARTPYRQLAGLIEVAMKSHFMDKTQWRGMLTAGNPEVGDISERLLAAKEEAYEVCPLDFEDFLEDDDTITTLTFPGTHFPERVQSVNLGKTPEVEGKLTAIKGQYLIFDDGRVFNVRRHSGFRVSYTFG
jgi:hypothetical protein